MFEMSQRWQLDEVARFMAIPDLYWASNDRLAPQPEQMDFRQHLMHPDVGTYVARYQGTMIGYTQFIRKTSIGAEMHVAFLQPFRGRVAREMVRYAMANTFKEYGLLKLWSPISSDNKPALFAARHIGMREEGRLTQAIVREGGIRDLIVYAITKEKFLGRKTTNGAG
jgi:RimJ/RimL family protein N-acetyltransferase